MLDLPGLCTLIRDFQKIKYPNYEHTRSYHPVGGVTPPLQLVYVLIKLRWGRNLTRLRSYNNVDQWALDHRQIHVLNVPRNCDNALQPLS
jgi:hypothetical protein